MTIVLIVDQHLLKKNGDVFHRIHRHQHQQRLNEITNDIDVFFSIKSVHNLYSFFFFLFVFFSLFLLCVCEIRLKKKLKKRNMFVCINCHLFPPVCFTFISREYISLLFVLCFLSFLSSTSEPENKTKQFLFL